MGKLFRAVMYPEYGPHGNGLLRLHSTYRHDLKIYSSDEGRVQTSAAAFTQGLLDLEGTSLTPILVRYAQVSLWRVSEVKVHPWAAANSGSSLAQLPLMDIPTACLSGAAGHAAHDGVRPAFNCQPLSLGAVWVLIV